MLLGCSVRYASGIIEEYQFSEGLLNETMLEELNVTRGYMDCANRTCEYGLIQSQQMIEVLLFVCFIIHTHTAVHNPGIVEGIFGLYSCRKAFVLFLLLRCLRRKLTTHSGRHLEFIDLYFKDIWILQIV